jgi:hypothetical protein
VPEDRGFIFTTTDRRASRTVRTLRQFARELERQDLDPYLRRGDFSRWIGDVFGDRSLAGELRELEARYRAAPWTTARADVTAAIRGRYDLTRSDATTGVRVLSDAGTPTGMPTQPDTAANAAGLTPTADVI